MFFDPAVTAPATTGTAITLGSLTGKDLSALVLALGALGTAAYGVVDASKVFGGGPSNAGFRYIKRVMKSFFPQDGENDQTTGLALGSILRTLKSNWINGMPAAEQKSIVKSLIKLRLNGTNAEHLAKLTGVN